jgi:benzoyl-CoA 2,3-dioxygenase component B
MNMNIMNVDYSTKIPNNVNLSEDRQVLKALEGWHPGYIDWWHDMGPEGFQQSLVYLRTAYSVDPRGWAKFDYVKMPDYRWGILLAPQEENRVVPFGEHFGEPAWQEVPGEYRAMLRRLIVIQGDTEPASVEQQRHLGKTAHGLSAAEIFWPRWPRGGRRAVASPFGRCGFAAHARGLQREDAGLAVLLHVHLFHRP